MAHPTDERNFRLPLTVRPRRYTAHLALDLEARRFAGTQTVELTLQESAAELVLHALELQLTRVEARVAGRRLGASVRVAPVSETVVLTFPEALPAGEVALDVEWAGRFNPGLRGLYLAGPVAATQFEAADARRLFPCFDEPAFKARWRLSVHVPAGLVALSNGAPERDEPEGEGRRVTFRETEVLSSYLVALVVGPLAGAPEEAVNGVPLRTWALPEKAHLTRFGQEVARAVLPRLQDYFGLPYAFGKVDQVGIPDFEAGAMENAGLITYREVALLLEPASAPLAVQKRVAEVVTHELAHQWFGNWVTMVWWDDLWLNEAFATWMAYKVVDAWRPHWRLWLDFDAGKSEALHLDALHSTHPIRAEVHNATQAGENFDAITYEKGGAVLRMMEGFLGEGPFREGIRAYMRRHARANAVADDLWAALGEASRQPVLELANAWIGQSGFPLVGVSLEGQRVRLSQRRFYAEPGARSAERWPVPMVLRWADAQGGLHEERLVLRGAEGEQTLAAPPRWLCANAEGRGFYRVAYEAGALARLADHLGALAPAERIGLLADQWALVRADVTPIGAFLTLAGRYGGERDWAVLNELVGRLAYVEARLVDGEDQERLRAWVRALLGGALAGLGWEPAAGEGDEVRLRRAVLVRGLGLVAREPAVRAEARARVGRLLAGEAKALEPNLLDSAVALAAREGDGRLFDTLLERFAHEPDPATRRRYLLGLTAFEDPAQGARARALVFTDKVPMQDAAMFVTGLMSNRTLQEAAWKDMRGRWDEVLARTGGAPMLLRRMVESLGHLRERRHLEEARTFLQAHPLEAAQQAVAQTLERLAHDVSLRERCGPEVSAWLRRGAA